MGRRTDDFIGEAIDAAIRRAVQTSAQSPLEPPPDLVTRTLRRLPAASPAMAARAEVRRRTRRLILLGTAVISALLIATLSLWSVVGSGPSLALIFGDGSGGVSRFLLTLQLLGKPFVGILTTVVPDLFAASIVLLVIGIWLWWRLFQRTPAYALIDRTR